jgi:hypothetical protein
MRRIERIGLVSLLAAGGAALGVGCSSEPAVPARTQFLNQLQQPGVHRFDAVVIGKDGAPALSADVASCIANAFEHDKWPLEAAIQGKVPTGVDVKMLNLDISACQKDPGTTTIGPFG